MFFSKEAEVLLKIDGYHYGYPKRKHRCFVWISGSAEQKRFCQNKDLVVVVKGEEFALPCRGHRILYRDWEEFE